MVQTRLTRRTPATTTGTIIAVITAMLGFSLGPYVIFSNGPLLEANNSYWMVASVSFVIVFIEWISNVGMYAVYSSAKAFCTLWGMKLSLYWIAYVASVISATGIILLDLAVITLTLVLSFALAAITTASLGW